MAIRKVTPVSDNTSTKLKHDRNRSDAPTVSIFWVVLIFINTEIDRLDLI